MSSVAFNLVYSSSGAFQLSFHTEKTPLLNTVITRDRRFPIVSVGRTHKPALNVVLKESSQCSISGFIAKFLKARYIDLGSLCFHSVGINTVSHNAYVSFVNEVVSLGGENIREFYFDFRKITFLKIPTSEGSKLLKVAYLFGSGTEVGEPFKIWVDNIVFVDNSLDFQDTAMFRYESQCLRAHENGLIIDTDSFFGAGSWDCAVPIELIYMGTVFVMKTDDLRCIAEIRKPKLVM